MSEKPLFTHAWWKLYRDERLKIAPFNVRLTSPQITHAARTATRRYLDAK